MWLRRRRAASRAPLALAWGLTALVLVAGSFVVNEAGETERGHLRDMLQGIAPTYAAEMQQLGHARVTFDTPPDTCTCGKSLRMWRTASMKATP